MSDFCTDFKQLDHPPKYTLDGELIFTVSDLNQATRQLLESHFGCIYLIGEISNFSRPSSGHLYFSLKDERSQVRCAWFRPRQTAAASQLSEGAQVIVKAKVSLYPDRGDYQLIIEEVTEAGLGFLMQQLAALKEKLLKAGLFDLAHKKPLPAYPRVIGVISAEQSAALQDILSVLARRFPLAEIQVYASLVQGKEAVGQLIQAIQYADRIKAADVLILARGGGSFEDLWCFNDERLAQLIFRCSIPIVSAVGHETDTSIADLVADLRAPTPSAAAELVSPDQLELLEILQSQSLHLKNALIARLRQTELQLQHLKARLKHPAARLSEQSQALQANFKRLEFALFQRLYHWQYQLSLRQKRLVQASPLVKLNNRQSEVRALSQRLEQALFLQLQTRQQAYLNLVARLDTLSPLAVLKRGYALVQNQKHGLVTQPELLRPSEHIEVLFEKVKIRCEVISTHPRS